MFNLIDALVRKGHTLIVEKHDVMTVLDAIDEINSKSKFSVLISTKIGSCGWADEPTKWFIIFDSSNRDWKRILTELYKGGKSVVLKEDNRFYLE